MADKYQSREQRRKALQEEKGAKKGPKTNQRKNLFKKILLTVLIVGIVGLLTGIGTFAYYVKDTPPLDETLLKVPVPSKVYDRNGELAAEIGGHEAREYVEYDEIPQLVQDAFLATEDVRFFEHKGVDYRRLAGAVLANVTRGFGAEGGSTITQQLVKLSFLSTDKTLKRKAQEFYLAYELESRFSKEQILEMYLNRIYFSNYSYGIAKAAKNYYGKSLDELELHEAAMLAGLPQSPNNYNPLTNPENAEKRRNIVLGLMVQHGKITQEQADEAKATPIDATLASDVEKTNFSNKYNAFMDRVIEEISEQIGEVDPQADGLEIYTTLDVDAQEHVEYLLSDESGIAYPENEDFQAGVSLIDTKTGEIRAIGGGRNHEKQGWNYATDIRVQPGSAIKPILDYGPAIEHLDWSTYQQIDDEPVTYTNGDPINNWDKKHKGVLSIREHLADSRNIPALKAFQEVGADKARDFAVKLGIPLGEDIPEAYSIGGFNKGISPLQLAGAYAPFGNGGVYTEPFAVTKVVFQDGKSINLNKESQVVMKDSTAFLITDMLKTSITSGLARAANVPGLHLAGKSGTTNFSTDELQKYDIPEDAAPSTLFAGYTPSYTAAVWTGFNKGGEDNYLRSIASGSEDQYLSREIFRQLMEHVSSTEEDKADFPVPKSVVRVAVEKGSNPPLKASEFTPKDRITNEYFVKGTEPTKVSKEFEKLASPSNFTATYDEASNQILLNWDYPEDQLENVSFDVKVAVNEGSPQALTVTKELGMAVNNPDPGATFTFEITAFLDENKESRSDPATQSVQVPELVEEEEIVPELPITPPGEGEGEGEGDGTGEGEGEGEGEGDGTGEGTGEGGGTGGDTGGGTGGDTGGGTGGDTGGGTGGGTGDGGDGTGEGRNRGQNNNNNNDE
ncbi:penicillin-binding protein 1A [Bacillus tianshenii]|uniref:Penicillin-binding protein 1A n=1 Tax=Sutcliffiella tianshenii TaxID=1463404 RepID=A0ABS2NYB3_9BACI|nr:PBP1A family penicillin-binding protein [Bacillus tianshenii]MBM7619508.1 penicillin-binding protein 1A [Bacillus tianshenii]